MTSFRCVQPSELERFLERQWQEDPHPTEQYLADHFVEVLRKANEFVPSEAGSILLDISGQREASNGHGELTFIAAFGSTAEQIVGCAISTDRGVAGHVFSSGQSMRSSDPGNDEHFDSAFDEENGYTTRSLVAIPIRLDGEIFGVLELLNREKIGAFSREDVVLLEIFADYLSVSIRNVIDGRRAHEIARRDNLTGLLNDRSLHPEISRMITECREKSEDFSILFIDLDYFKHVNDSHGHLTGSQVLREVGQLLGEICVPVGAMAARYGGDEFVVAQAGANLDEGIDLAETIRNDLVTAMFCDEPTELQPEVVRLTGITCSIGVASLGRHTTPELSVEDCKSTLLRLADAAMYVSKETGRNRTAVAGEVVPRRAPRTPPQLR